MMLPATAQRPVGQLLREWRQRRRLSQLDLAADAAISTRHLSFVETGRAAPSRAMLLKLAEQLQVPLRERNVWLTAAGFAPMYAERALSDPALGAARAAVQAVLEGHEPHPALAVDRHWNMLAHNRMIPLLLDDQIAPQLMQPPVNVLRLSLHPQGLAARILNLGEWRAHLLERLHHQVALTADPVLATLAEELRGYPAPPAPEPTSAHAVAVPLRVQSAAGPLSFISTITVFGTPIDITLAELALETFFPADEATAQALRRLHAQLQPAATAAHTR
jgi:transcriptional regulator with XRE-family HTH domain